MIRHVLDIIIEQLEAYIQSVSPAGSGALGVVAGNIGLSSVVGGTDGSMDNSIVISVVNIMEEASLKNSSPYILSTNGQEKENPPTYINLFLMFTSILSSDSDGTPYLNNLVQLSRVIEFFQGKNTFSISDSPIDSLTSDPSVQDLCVEVELVSLTFEQINYLWGSLGGKQLPFVLYKIQVLPIRRENVIGRGGLIQEIESQLVDLNVSQS